jgi:glycosyltransferase involved in cell wall biosynthesis
MEKVSVVIATKDEERNIKGCLESVKWADEIIIVDDASRDRTVEICREYTDKIFINDSKGDFHRNKNFGIEKANGDWILSLDADERITDKLSEEIKVAVQDEKKVGYYLNRKNYFLGKWVRGCGWYPDYIIRLFRKGTTRWPLLTEDFHGTPKIKEKKKTDYLKNEFIHYSYFSISQYLEKFNLYTTALAKKEYHQGTKMNFFLCFLLKPGFVFSRKYFLMRGYGDGFPGFFISVASALTIFMTYTKLWEMYRKD